MRISTGALLVCTLVVGCAHARSPAGTAGPGASPIEIADGRGGWPQADVSPWKSSPPVMEAIAAARSYWSAQGAYEEDVEVQSTATGRFSRSGVEQRVVLYRMSVYPRGFPMRGLALLEDGELVRNFAFTGLANDLQTLPDIDGDGRDEILFSGSFAMGGQFSWGVSLASFADEGIEHLGNAVLYDETCGMGRPELGGPTASRIWFTPGSGMTAQRYRRESCEVKTWEPQGEPEPFTWTGAGETTYTEISSR